MDPLMNIKRPHEIDAVTIPMLRWETKITHVQSFGPGHITSMCNQVAVLVPRRSQQYHLATLFQTQAGKWQSQIASCMLLMMGIMVMLWWWWWWMVCCCCCSCGFNCCNCGCCCCHNKSIAKPLRETFQAQTISVSSTASFPFCSRC